MTALVRALGVTVLSCLLFAAGGVLAQGGGLQISPLLVEVPPSSNIATYTLENRGSAAIGVQVKAFRWQQDDGERLLEPAKNLMVVPAIINIAPGQSQLVRAALRGSRPDEELSYRVHFQELPSLGADGAVQVQTLLKIDVPLFFAAKKSRRAYDIKLAVADGEPFVTVTNKGSRYLRFSNFELLDSGGNTVATHEALMYLLPGTTRRWSLEPARPGFVADSKAQYQLQVTSEGKSEKHLVEIK